MKPDDLLQAFRQILEDVAPDEIKRRVDGAQISDQQWGEIEERLHLMRLMNMRQEVEQ